MITVSAVYMYVSIDVPVYVWGKGGTVVLMLCTMISFSFISIRICTSPFPLTLDSVMMRDFSSFVDDKRNFCVKDMWCEVPLGGNCILVILMDGSNLPSPSSLYYCVS